MIKRIRTRLGVEKIGDEGLTLIEVIVALMIFAILAVGVAYSLASVLTLNRDARSRVVAANIAAEIIDNARSIENVFTVVDDSTKTRQISGVTYRIRLETGWVTSADSNAQCGAAAATGAGALEYKRINVEVTWDGMRAGTTPIRSDTIIAPNSRINDPTLGTIVVFAENSLGKGSAGITVNTQPSSNPAGATAVAQQGLATDTDGCSYVLKVVPGNYDVTLTRSGYIDRDQNRGSTTGNVTVVAGGTALAKLSFDSEAIVSSTFPASAMVPTNLQTTYSSTLITKVLTGNPAYLFPDKYQLIAGTFDATGCKSPDPAAWATRSDGAFASRMDSVSLISGTNGAVAVPMGSISVSNTALNGKYITAVIQASVSGGDPGCATPTSSTDTAFPKYSFGTATSNTVKIALPYGTYKLYYSTTQGGTNNSLTGTLLSALGVSIGSANQQVTVDPRVVP
jgi:prepilin-type N-terminal cleavage/methylation domain-containing protein